MGVRTRSSIFWWCFAPAVVCGLVFTGLFLLAVIPALNRPPECGSLPRYTVDPATARPGDTVTFRAPAGSLDEYAAEYTHAAIVLTDAGGNVALHGRSPIDADGGVSFSFKVPATTRPGKAHISVTPQREELPASRPAATTPPSQPPSAAGSGPGFVRMSCSEPLGTLTIER